MADSRRVTFTRVRSEEERMSLLSSNTERTMNEGAMNLPEAFHGAGITGAKVRFVELPPRLSVMVRVMELESARKSEALRPLHVSFTG